MQLQGYDLNGIMETWQNRSHKWSAAIDGYRLFYAGHRKDRQGRRGKGVALYVREQLVCIEFCLKMDQEPTKS